MNWNNKRLGIERDDGTYVVWHDFKVRDPDTREMVETEPPKSPGEIDRIELDRAEVDKPTAVKLARGEIALSNIPEHARLRRGKAGPPSDAPPAHGTNK